MMTFNAALKIYRKGLSIKSISSNKIYEFNKSKLENASKKEKFGFWVIVK